MPPLSLARGISYGVAISVGALFVGCVIFYIVGGEAAWAAGIFFTMGFVPAVLSGGLAGAVVHALRRRGIADDAVALDGAGPLQNPGARWRRAVWWVLGALAGYAAVTYGLPLLGSKGGLVATTMVVPAMFVGAALAARANTLVGPPRMWARGIILAVAVAPFLAIGWWVVEGRLPLPPDVQQRWAADSLDHERQLARWVADSIALDSVAATRDRSAMVTLLRTQDSQRAEDALQAQACERSRLSDLHGSEVGERMVVLAEHEVWPRERDRKEAQRRLDGRVQGPFFISLGGEVCGPRSEPAPDKATELPVDNLGPRPYAPFRPRP